MFFSNPNFNIPLFPYEFPKRDLIFSPTRIPLEMVTLPSTSLRSRSAAGTKIFPSRSFPRIKIFSISPRSARDFPKDLNVISGILPPFTMSKMSFVIPLLPASDKAPFRIVPTSTFLAYISRLICSVIRFNRICPDALSFG